MASLTCVLSTPTTDPATAINMDFGQTVVFTATPGGGSDYHYQWKKNTVNVGTDQATYSYTPAVTADSITCYLTGTGGDPVLSTPCVITMAAALVMTTIPTAITIIVGETAHLVGIKAGGTTTFAYLWQTCDDAAGTNPQSATTTTIAKDYLPTAAGAFYIRIRCIDSAEVPVTVYSACITVTVKSLYEAMSSTTSYLAKIAAAV